MSYLHGYTIPASYLDSIRPAATAASSLPQSASSFSRATVMPASSSVHVPATVALNAAAVDVDASAIAAKVSRATTSTKAQLSTSSVTMSFSDQYLGDDGVIAACSMIVAEGAASKIASLDLRGNDIGIRGTRALVDFLRSASSLRSMSLEWNALGTINVDEHQQIAVGGGLDVLCDSLSPHRSLAHLDLRNNKIGTEHAAALARLISLNNSITHLDLRWNALKTSGGQRLVQAMRDNHTLVEVLLSGNGLSSDQISAIDAACVRNKQELFHKTSQINHGVVEPVAQPAQPTQVVKIQENIERIESQVIQVTASAEPADVPSTIEPVHKSIQSLPVIVASAPAVEYDDSEARATQQEASRVVYRATHPGAAGSDSLSLAERRTDELEVHLAAEVQAHSLLRQELIRLRAEHAELRVVAEHSAHQSQLTIEREQELRLQACSDRDSAAEKLAALQAEHARALDRLAVRARTEEELRLRAGQDYSAMSAQAQLNADETQRIAEQAAEELRLTQQAAAADKALAAKILADKTIEFERHLQRVQAVGTQRAEALEAALKTATEARASAERAASAARSSELERRLEHETAIAALENRLVSENSEAMEAERLRCEARIAEVEASRQALQAQHERASNDSRAREQNLDRELSQCRNWLTECRHELSLEAQARRVAEARVTELETENRSLHHAIEVRSIELEHAAAAQREQQAAQGRATEDLLAARAAELRAFDERLRARDDELNRAHLQIREYKLRIAKQADEMSRKEEAWQATLSGMRAAVSETMSERFTAAFYENFASSAAAAFAGERSRTDVLASSKLSQPEPHPEYSMAQHDHEVQLAMHQFQQTHLDRTRPKQLVGDTDSQGSLSRSPSERYLPSVHDIFAGASSPTSQQQSAMYSQELSRSSLSEHDLHRHNTQSRHVPARRSPEKRGARENRHMQRIEQKRFEQPQFEGAPSQDQ